ncbi:MAG: hypothetical protein F6J97_24740, partial [Leptolyngbya sp. SIO4C1]|nr:hypothetical protein [Leptolyngbya sp. SIO4C1]
LGFGGMASAAGVGDDVVTFFDMAGNQIGQDITLILLSGLFLNLFNLLPSQQKNDLEQS